MFLLLVTADCFVLNALEEELKDVRVDFGGTPIRFNNRVELFEGSTGGNLEPFVLTEKLAQFKQKIRTQVHSHQEHPVHHYEDRGASVPPPQPYPRTDQGGSTRTDPACPGTLDHFEPAGKYSSTYYQL